MLSGLFGESPTPVTLVEMYSFAIFSFLQGQTSLLHEYGLQTSIWISCLSGLPTNPDNSPSFLSFLRSAGRGLVAGDFNPVLDEDVILIETNGLTDAWVVLRPEEPGYTW